MRAGAWRRLVELFRRERLDADVAQEMSHHLDLLVDRKVAAGLGETEARRLARAELGSTAAAREAVAENRTGFAIEQARRELRGAVRSLWRSPHATALSVVTIGMGIGASAVLFALVDGIVLQPLPYPDSDRLVRVFDTNPAAGVDQSGVASGNIADWRRRATGFDGIAGYYAMGRTVSDGDAEVVLTANVSREFFDVMGVQPEVGRVFTEDEFLASQYSSAMTPIGVDPVVIVSHDVWMRRFGGDEDVAGRTVTLDRQPFRIVGVMPERFAFPDEGVALWIPWDLSGNRPRDQHYLGAVGRLRSGVSVEAAGVQLNEVAAALGTEYPESNRGWGVTLAPLQADLVGETAPVLWLLFAGVVVVLFVGCANVALLGLLRGMERADEAALRIALGASSGRLLREFLLEAMTPAVLGGALGAGLAVSGVRLLPLLAADLPRLDDVSIDMRTLAFIAATTMAMAVLSGLPQAWRRTRAATVRGLSSNRSRVTPERHRLRDLLALSQVGLAVALLLVSGLLARTVIELQRVDSGFDSRGVLVAPVFLDGQAYPTGAATRAYYQTLFERLSAVPGVEAVGGATTVPTGPLGPDFERPVWPEDASDTASRMPAAVRMVTAGYVEAMGLRMVDGRAIGMADSPDAPPVVMVSETLARRVWPGQRAVGRHLVVDYASAGTHPYEVVGVVGDVQFRGPRSEPLAEVYFPHAQRSYLILNVVVKTAGDSRLGISAVREALRAVDPQQPAHGVYALGDLVGATYSRDRQAMMALLVFAAAAIGLAVLGVYGVLAHRVRERARELGIRLALGASPSRLLSGVIRSGLSLVASGAVVGLFAAWSLTGLFRARLFLVSPADPSTAVVVILFVAVAGLVASAIPAWRAARVDPVTVLRRG